MELKIEYIPVDKLEPYEKNARKHQDDDVQTIANSITRFGFDDPIGIWSDHNVVVEGHGRLLAAKQLGMTEVPCIRLDHLTDAERRAYALAHNRTAELSMWDDELLDLELDELALEDIDMESLGFDTVASEGGSEHKNALSDRYLVPPFTVIYGNKGEWLARKRAWIQFGIHSEIGRGGTCATPSRMDGETVTHDKGDINGRTIQNSPNG